MRNHLTVANQNLTPYIVDGTYDIQTDDQSEKWNDANMLEHRVIISTKVTGSFQIVCSNRANSITLADFLALWESAVDNGVVTLGLYVPSRNSFEALDCYYEIKSADHILTADQEFIDVLTISLKER